MVIDGITNDPAWANGEYKTQPPMGLRIAADMLILAGGAPLQMQKSFPTRDASDKDTEDYVAKQMATLDANDLLYQVDSSRNYDPSGGLDKIKAPMMWINLPTTSSTHPNSASPRRRSRRSNTANSC